LKKKNNKNKIHQQFRKEVELGIEKNKKILKEEENFQVSIEVEPELPKKEKRPAESQISGPSKKLKQSGLKSQRCIFYPNCTKEDCPFIHPTDTCRYFPNCPYGNQCIYEHPPCKYAGKCSRKDCIYFHPINSTVDCKNGFACSNKTECVFKHPPIACKYSNSCPNKAKCLFFPCPPLPFFECLSHCWMHFWPYP